MKSQDETNVSIQFWIILDNTNFQLYLNHGLQLNEH